MYQDLGTQVKRLSDGWIIPKDERNFDYVQCLRWIAEGNEMENGVTIESRRVKVWESIKAERDRRMGNGVKVGANWFQSDTNSRIQQLALVMLGASIPAGVQWKTLGGSKVPMTQTLASQIFAAEAASDIAIFARAEALKDLVYASSDPESIDITVGWPITFGE